MPGQSAILDSMLAPGGPVARAMGMGFEVRPQQRRMCEAVAHALETRSHLLVEAGTGVGKSFAYLLPAALRAMVQGEVVVISTHTISLQEQLIEKDIPLVQRVLEELRESGQLPSSTAPDAQYRALRSVLVKGRGNYVSVRRLALASQRQDRLFADAPARCSLHVIEDWAKSTLDGTLSTLPVLERPGVWTSVQSDSGNCMGRKCPNHDMCFYQNARAKLDGANLLVCNHALFFSDLALRAQDTGFLPAYQHVIFDEAHNVEEVAGEHFGASLTEGRITHLLSGLYNDRTGRGVLAQLATTCDSAGVGRAIALVQKAAEASSDFFAALGALIDGARGHPRQDRTWTQRNVPGASEPRTRRLREAGAISNLLTPAFRELALRLRGLKDDVTQDADKFELNAFLQRCEMVAMDAEILVSQALEGCAYWIESSSEERGVRRLALACGPVEVGPILKERLFGQGHSVVLTSATLATRTARADTPREHAEAAFTHAMQRLGCDGAATLQLGSPFDYSTQVEFYVDLRKRVALPGMRVEQEDEDFRDQAGSPRVSRRPSGDAKRLSALIVDHVRATQGGAFVLFTSYTTLRACITLCAEALLDLRLPLLAQGRDGSRTLLLQRFREDPRSVLFGAASFWQGVDVRGDALRNVIITKLPFDPPDRPLTQARLELIEERGGNPFMEESLPRAVIRFKQGFGRLIRSACDRGRVVVLDDRVVTARYGRLFTEALPEGVTPRVLRDSAREEETL